MCNYTLTLEKIQLFLKASNYSWLVYLCRLININSKQTNAHCSPSAQENTEQEVVLSQLLEHQMH